MRLGGHLWTVYGHLARRARRVELPPAEPWTTEVADECLGALRLTGALLRAERPEAIVIVHGLGGCSDSGYVQAVAAAAHRRHLSSLRVNLRGADRLGEDYYHAGLTADLRAALESPALQSYDRLLVLGFSLGGHLALRYLLEGADPQVVATAAVCTPLDLAACCDWIDRPAGWLYRRYLLQMLMQIYRPVAARRTVPLAVEEAARIRSQREFDDRVIAPRHGFAGVDDYYRQTSIGPHLGEIDDPVLLVLAEDDPMIPRASQLRHLEGVSASVDTRWVRGGHVGFSRRLSLGEPGPVGLEEQVISWLLGAATGRGSDPSAC